MLGRVEAADYTGSEEDVQAVSDLMDKIRDALTDYQVSVNLRQFLRPPSLNRSVQAAQQKVIHDLGLELIVSR